LLILHAFRYLGLSLIVPGQIDPAVSRDALQVMAWGDFASGVFALLAAIAVHHRRSASTAMVTLFSLVGNGDLIAVGFTATKAGSRKASRQPAGRGCRAIASRTNVRRRTKGDHKMNTARKHSSKIVAARPWIGYSVNAGAAKTEIPASTLTVSSSCRCRRASRQPILEFG
jgi:hypothetical protein